MNVTEVRIAEASTDGDPARPDGRVVAYAGVVLDGTLAIHDLKVIAGNAGTFVAFPSRKIADKCPACRSKNHLRARYCNECGSRLLDGRGRLDEVGRPVLHADVVHPITAEGRRSIADAVLAECGPESRLRSETARASFGLGRAVRAVAGRAAV